MITLISGTNRANNQTLNFANFYLKLLKEKNVEAQLLDLASLPHDFIFSALYGVKNQQFEELMQQYIYGVDKLVILSPEYNGSYPGVLKAFIDGWNPKSLSGQKAALVGVASGRQGNSRGMDQLSDVLNYLGITIVPLKIPIAQIHQYLSTGELSLSPELNQLIEKQLKSLI